MPTGPGDVTRLLQAWGDGDPEARDELIPLIFDDLRRIAQQYYSRERQGHTLHPTALVNELYLKLEGRKGPPWRNREQFFAVASKMIRHILVDYARRRSAQKRGGDAIRVVFDEAMSFSEGRSDELLALHEALARLAEEDARSARVVELHAFGGLTFDEIARVLDLARSTVMRDWKFARLWLRRYLSGTPPGESS